MIHHPSLRPTVSHAAKTPRWSVLARLNPSLASPGSSTAANPSRAPRKTRPLSFPPVPQPDKSSGESPHPPPPKNPPHPPPRPFQHFPHRPPQKNQHPPFPE